MSLLLEIVVHILQFDPYHNHRSKFECVLVDIKTRYPEMLKFSQACSNCFVFFEGRKEVKIEKFILFRKFYFCGHECNIEFECHYRESYREWLRRKRLKKSIKN